MLLSVFMLITVQSLVGGPGVTTFAAVLASVTEGIYWDCDLYGSSVATWAGREPTRVVDHRDWHNMQQSWSADVKTPPLSAHLTPLWGTKALIGNIDPHVQGRTDRDRLSMWAEQTQSDILIADRGRAPDLVSARWRFIVCRPYKDQLWRTWFQFEKGLAPKSAWVLCGEPRFNEDAIDAKELKEDWGLEHCYTLPWNKKLASAIIRGKQPPRGPYRNEVTKMANSMGISQRLPEDQ